MKQDSMEKRFKRMIKAVRIGKCLVIVNHSTEILAFIKQELEDIFSKLPSKDDPLSREEMLDIIEEQRRKVGLG